MSTLFAALDEIRSLVNSPRRQKQLMEDGERWSQISVCMDVISDCQQAIRGYLAQTTADHDTLYLTTYGVLQAFVTQQDAVAQLAAALAHPLDGWEEKKKKNEMSWERGHPELSAIRPSATSS